MATCLIGIDGGGTACRFAVIRDGERADFSLGPANASTDRAGAVATLRQGLRHAGDLSGAVVHAGLAGVMTEPDAASIAAQFPELQITVTDDRPTTLSGALGARQDGTVVSIGTGSFAGRRSGGACRFAGGWGLALGDEASGAWLGREALSAALRAEDGLERHTPLTQGLVADWGGPAGIVRFASAAGPADFAALAPRVIGALEDDRADAILRLGAQWIARLVLTVGWRAPEPLCLTGGLGPAYARFLRDDMRAVLVTARGTALDGAVWLAKEASRHD